MDPAAVKTSLQVAIATLAKAADQMQIDGIVPPIIVAAFGELAARFFVQLSPDVRVGMMDTWYEIILDQVEKYEANPLGEIKH